MKYVILILPILAMANCSKPKTVLICGDHVCVNKVEANQFFEENLSLEVKIINNKVKKNIDLVELNLKENKKGKREIKISPREKTKKKLKILSEGEIIKIKKKIKKKKKQKKIAKKIIVNQQSNENIKINKVTKDKNKKNEFTKDYYMQNNMNKEKKNIIDVCSLLKKCNIDEISKYLLNQGMKKKFPDITTRQ